MPRPTTAQRDRRHLIQSYTQPETRYIEEPDCEPHEGYGGFTIKVTRVFREPGESEVDHREVFTTVYTPSDSVVCGPPPGERD